MTREAAKLTNVHDALQKAQEKARDRVTLVNANFKIHPVLKVVAEQICEVQGVTLSDFLRECAYGLVRDYAGEKELQKLIEAKVLDSEA
jgi:hypothetical protein